jgi:hypothetical protein
MKFNWGTGIVISFIIFAASILLIVLFPFNQKADLVSEDYYEREIKFQEQIDIVERTGMLSESVSFEHNINELNINFPDEGISGEILFYRPADSKKDFSLQISTDTRTQSVDISTLQPGYWKVKVLWNMNNLKYYSEKTIVI